MLFDKSDLTDEDTLRRISFFEHTHSNMNLGMTLYSATEFRQHPLSKALFTPVTAGYDSASVGSAKLLLKPMLPAIYKQFCTYMSAPNADVTLMAINNLNLDLSCKLKVFQAAFSGYLSVLQRQELS